MDYIILRNNSLQVKKIHDKKTTLEYILFQ